MNGCCVCVYACGCFCSLPLPPSLFILFDLEIAFLFPWAAISKDIVASDSIKLFGFIEMLVFVTVLVVGYIYAWAKGALEWE